MATRSISFPKKEALASGILHVAGTLIVTLTGPGSGNMDLRTVMDAIIDTFRLGPDTVEEIYRNSSGPKWFFRLRGEAFAKHYDRLHGMSRLNRRLGVTLSIVHREKEKLRGFLNWLPSTLTEKYAQLIAADVSGDPNAEVKRTGYQTDRWCFKYEPVQDYEVPHYVNLTLTDEVEEDYENKVWVTLPGRRTPCSFCQQDTHWESKCPTRTERKARRPKADPLSQRPEKVLLPQAPLTNNENLKRPEDKPRAPDDYSLRNKDFASSNQNEPKVQTNNRRQKQTNKQTPRGKQQPCRQNSPPRRIAPASNPKDDSPDQRKVKKDWREIFSDEIEKHDFWGKYCQNS
jgi:hypothetical protein